MGIFITKKSVIFQTENVFKVRIVRTDSLMVRVTGVEPASLAALDPKSSASANTAIPAY